MPSGIVPGAGIDKNKVNYRQHEQCSSCVYFFPLNSCEIVDGNISPDNVCDLWEVKKNNEGKDAEFYLSQYVKSGK